jgi:hypothetical protein
MMRMRGLAAASAPFFLLAACGSSHVDTLYIVSSVHSGAICLTLPTGVPAKGQPDHFCDTWPPARIIGDRPLSVGDCVVLRLHPESSGTSQLLLTDPARCSP